MRNRFAGTSSAIAITGCIANGPWKLAVTSYTPSPGRYSAITTNPSIPAARSRGLQIFGDHYKPLDRADGIARVSGRDRDPVCRGGKSGFGIAVAERAVANDVAPERRMQ